MHSHQILLPGTIQFLFFCQKVIYAALYWRVWKEMPVEIALPADNAIRNPNYNEVNERQACFSTLMPVTVRQ